MLIFIILLSGILLNATTVEFTEDAYCMQAPQEVVNLVEQAAQLMNYNDTYQVVVPKKAGIQINPWNQFAACGFNTQNAYPFIIVNPEWFMVIPQDEQFFLLGRYFLLLQHGMSSFYMKIFPYVWILCIILILLGLMFTLSNTMLSKYSRGVRALVAYGIIIVCHFAFLNKTQELIMHSLGQRHDTYINNMVIERTGNKEAAIKALEHFDTSIKQAYNQDKSFWQPYVDLFKGYADELKK